MRWLSRTSARGNPPPVGWSFLILAAAVIGGLAAAEIRHVPLLVAILVPLAFGGLTVYGLARWPGGLARWPGRQQTAPGPPTPAAPRPRLELRTRADAVSPPQAQAQVWLQPTQPTSARDSQWWQKASGPAPEPGRDSRPVPDSDLASYLVSTTIAQCPNCGAFGIEVRHTSDGRNWSFRCDSCDHRWGWTPGTPWPPIHVMPGRRKPPRPPAP
jgi:hypothetical protein